jgi:hypothetical protein
MTPNPSQIPSARVRHSPKYRTPQVDDSAVLEHFEADFHIGYQRVCDRIILLKKGRAETETEKPEGGE